LVEASADTTAAPSDGAVALDTIPTVLVAWRLAGGAAERADERERLGAWLKVRLDLDTIQVIDRAAR
jgi:hypothetical protein